MFVKERKRSTDYMFFDQLDHLGETRQAMLKPSEVTHIVVNLISHRMSDSWDGKTTYKVYFKNKRYVVLNESDSERLMSKIIWEEE